MPLQKILWQKRVGMESIQVETVVQIIALLGGTVTLLLGLLQIVDTYLDIGKKLHKRRLMRKRKRPDRAA